MDTYEASDGGPDYWARHREGYAPSAWNYNKFIRVRAWSSRTENKYNYIQLCFWCGNTYTGKTQTYANGMGPVAGDYTMTKPLCGTYCSNWVNSWYGRYCNSDLLIYFTQTTMPSSNKPSLMQHRYHDFYYDEYGEVLVFSMSSYASTQGGASIWSMKGQTAFNSHTVTVEEGDDGNIYIQIGGQSCSGIPNVTIGRKTNHEVNVTTEGNGTVNMIPNCQYHVKGETVTLTPQPANSSVCFKGWTGADASYVIDNGNGTYRLTMQARDMNVIANFGACTIEVTEEVKLCG